MENTTFNIKMDSIIMVNSYLYFARRHYFFKRLVLFHVPGKIMH